MASDAAASALDVLARCRRYSRWLFDMVRPHLGARIVEAGAGLGTQSELLLRLPGRTCVLTDADGDRVSGLERRFGDRPEVSVRRWRLPEPFPLPAFRPDTFASWNVLEHVRDDVGALEQMRRALVPGGRVVVFAPAGRSLLSALDREMGHFRRYARRELTRKARAAGLRPLLERRVNLLGVPGWLFSAKRAGRPRLSPTQARLFDALVPLLRLWEDHLPVPVGLSVLYVGVRP